MNLIYSFPSVKTLKIALSVFLLLLSTSVFSQNSSTDRYLKEMPTVERVMSDFDGADPMDAAAAQVAVFRLLPEWMALITDNEMGFKERSKLYNKMHAMYRQAEGEIINRIVNSFDADETKRLGMNSPRAKWYNTASKYQYDPAVKEKLLRLYFSDEWKSRYTRLRAISDSLSQVANTNSPETVTLSPSTPPPIEKKDAGYSRLIILSLGIIIFLGLFPYLVFVSRKQPVYQDQVLRVDGREYNIYNRTGTVVNTTKTSTTRTYTTGGGYDSQAGRYNPTTTHTTTTIHDQIFLIDKDQREHVIQLAGWDLPTREGNELTMIWAIKKGMKEGPYVIALNHSTKMKYHMESQLSKIFTVVWKRWYSIGLLPMLIIPVLWGMYIVEAARSHTRDSVFSSQSGTSLSEHLITYGWLWAIYFLAWLVGATLAARTTQKRMKNFVDSIRMDEYKMK